MENIEMRVSRDTKIKDIAGAIAGEIGDGSIVTLSCIGSAALYAAVKGICMAEYMLNRAREKDASETKLEAHMSVDPDLRRRIRITVACK